MPIEGRGVYLSELHELLDVDTTGVADGQVLAYSGAASNWQPETFISLADLKAAEVAASADFADFQSRIAAL